MMYKLLMTGFNIIFKPHCATFNLININKMTNYLIKGAFLVKAPSKSMFLVCVALSYKRSQEKP